uniref:Kazal-like domain-containing protein n=1 Tax=Glossina pallidipes TaxID=7398 RepID=A0A1B0ADK6_GLOPL
MNLIILQLILLQVSEWPTNVLSLPYKAIQFPNAKQDLNDPHNSHYHSSHCHHFQHDPEFHRKWDHGDHRFENDHYHDNYFEHSPEFHRHDMIARISPKNHDQAASVTTEEPSNNEKTSTIATKIADNDEEDAAVSFDLRTNFQVQKNCRLITATGRCINNKYKDYANLCENQ